MEKSIMVRLELGFKKTKHPPFVYKKPAEAISRHLERQRTGQADAVLLPLASPAILRHIEIVKTYSICSFLWQPVPCLHWAVSRAAPFLFWTWLPPASLDAGPCAGGDHECCVRLRPWWPDSSCFPDRSHSSSGR